MTRSPFLAVLACLAVACGESHSTDGGPGDGGGRDAGGTRDGGARDGGAAGDFTGCAASSDCVVVPASCCGACGAATREDSIAVNASRASAYRTSVCPMGAACPPCFMEQDPTLVATCSSGTCAVVDVLAQPYAGCTMDSECRLRSRDCCECGGDVTRTGLIAIRTDGEAAYMDTVCVDGAMTGCPECAPTYPTDAAAACDVANGHCHVLWAR